MSSRGGVWEGVTASVRGSSHERSGKPNQDSVKLLRSKGDATCLVAAVCDGHGGDRYVRSDVGSRLGVEVACALGRDAARRLGQDVSTQEVEDHLAGPLATSLVESWRDRVTAHLSAHPWTPEELQVVGPGIDVDPHISYGCTLVLAVLTGSWVAFVQIGDGDVTVVSGDEVAAPVPGDDRLVGSETTSLCLPTAVEDARVFAAVDELPEVVVLTSDGYANSFASDDWRADTALDLVANLRRDGLDPVGKRLPAWLAESARVGGDDVSMALVRRTDLSSGSQSTYQTETQGSTAAVPPPATVSGGRSGLGGWLAALVVGLLLGGGLTWMAVGGSGGDDAGPPAPEVIPTSVPTKQEAPDQVGGTEAGGAAEVEDEIPEEGEEVFVLEGPESVVVIAVRDRDSSEAPSARVLQRFEHAVVGGFDEVPLPWQLSGHEILLDGQLLSGLDPSDALRWDVDREELWMVRDDALYRFNVGRDTSRPICTSLGPDGCEEFDRGLGLPPPTRKAGVTTTTPPVVNPPLDTVDDQRGN